MIYKDTVKQLHATTYLKQKGATPVWVNYCNYSPPLIYGWVYDTFNFAFADPNYAAAMMHSIACLQIPVIVASGPYTCGGLFKTQ